MRIFQIARIAKPISMDTTSISLLNRVRVSSDKEAWNRFVDFYMPMIYRWALGIGLPKSDAFDLVHDIFLTLAQKLPSVVLPN